MKDKAILMSRERSGPCLGCGRGALLSWVPSFSSDATSVMAVPPSRSTAVSISTVIKARRADAAPSSCAEKEEVRKCPASGHNCGH